MTTQTLKRQVDRLKVELDALKPKPPANIKVLCEPDPAMGEAVRLAFVQSIIEAKKTHDQVLVGCFKWNDDRKGQTIDGVRYFESHVFAQLCGLSLRPSANGNENALDDVLKSARGSVFGPVENPPDGIDSGWFGRQVDDYDDDD